MYIQVKEMYIYGEAGTKSGVFVAYILHVVLTIVRNPSSSKFHYTEILVHKVTYEKAAFPLGRLSTLYINPIYDVTKLWFISMISHGYIDIFGEITHYET